MSNELEAIKKQRETAAVKREEIRRGLPHLYGAGWYQWAWNFFKSKNSMNLLCAANQISKSSTQIRKCIEWAGNPKLWPELWTTTPRQFWYLYPDQDTVDSEFKTKWEPEWMPCYAFKDHPTYGWDLIHGPRKSIEGIVFNSGVTVHFKTYTQHIKNLQSGTIHAVFCFPRGTLVLTPGGARAIEDLSLGDKVIDGKGSIEAVTEIFVRPAEVISRTFSNGRTLRATSDHPFWTDNRGWVQFGELTSKDQCRIVPGWMLIEKLYCLRESFSAASRRVRILASGITSGIAGINFFTLAFGKRCTSESSLRAMSSTTRTAIPWTTGPKISSSLLERSTPLTTKSLSGENGAPGNSPAPAAGLSLSRKALKTPPQDFVAKIAGGLERCVAAVTAGFLLKLAASLRKVSVLDYVPTVEKTSVYNITVSGSHTYFADGILVHNCDEELPETFYDELQARMFASNGYYHMVFTATLNQDMWKRAMEGRGDSELFPDAFKQQISMYECITYRDGKPGAYTEGRIKQIIASCKNPSEVQRRVFGKFVVAMGLKYGSFDASRHYKKPFDIPDDWRKYAAVDPGSGGVNHKPAIVFVAVRPDFRYGVVYKSWRGDDGSTYTSGDCFNKFLSLRGEEPLVSQRFDGGAKDFGTIATRAGEGFTPADKSHDLGEETINTLFKHDMLFLLDTLENRKMGSELTTLMKDTPKHKAVDDLCDGLRYNVVSIPWDWMALKGEISEIEKAKNEQKPYTDEERVEQEVKERRGEFNPKINDGWEELNDEFEFWNELCGS